MKIFAFFFKYAFYKPKNKLKYAFLYLKLLEGWKHLIDENEKKYNCSHMISQFIHLVFYSLYIYLLSKKHINSDTVLGAVGIEQHVGRVLLFNGRRQTVLPQKRK